MCSEMVFTIQGEPNETVKEFVHLGRTLAHDDRDDLTMWHNIQRARNRWGLASQMLAREGFNAQISAMFHKAVVQTVLLCRAETWAVSPTMMKTLESFHGCIVHKLSNGKPKRGPHAGEWNKPAFGSALDKAATHPVESLLVQQHKHLSDCI